MNNKKEKTQVWLIGWLEKMSIVAIFNGLFTNSHWSFWLGTSCAIGSLYLLLAAKETNK